MSPGTGFGLLGVVVLLLGGLVALDRFSLRLLRPARRPEGRTPADVGIDADPVTVPSEYPLHGWLTRPKEPRPAAAAVLLAHGWAANAGVVAALAAALTRAGHPVLLFDYRGHGRSADAPVVTIRHYRDDTEAAARWLADRHPERPIVLAGHSMGGAAAVLAAAEGAPAAALVLVAAPADVLEVTVGYMRQRGLPGATLVRLLRPFWRIRVGEPYRSLVPARRLEDVAVPVLVLQPESDRRVPEEHAGRLAAAAGTEVGRIPGTGHSDILDAPPTARAVIRFLSELEETSEA